MKIRLSQHFDERKKLRSIPDGLAEIVLRQADEYFENGISGWFIAVKRIVFQGKDRDVALTYTITGNEIVLITIHPLKEGQKDQRVENGRWIPHETPSLL
jgi:hypothetical protein